MPFDPSLPAPNSPLESQVVRDQLQALFVLINNIASISAAQVDSVNTVPPGNPAQVGLTVNGSTLHFTFQIPEGPQGPPFSAAVVDGVNTLNPGDPATVSAVHDGANVRFTFGIPRGHDGTNGSNGTDGSNGMDGAPGQQGPPGEVSQVQLDSAIATAISGTSANTNAIATLDTPFADPDMDTLRQKLNELILNGRR